MKNRINPYRLIMLVFACILLTGCSMPTHINESEKMKTLALNHLNENYDDTFVATGYLSSSWAYDYQTVWCNSEKYKEDVEVNIWKDNGSYIIKDNYYKLHMKNDAENYFTDMLSEYDNDYEVKIAFSEPYLPETIPVNGLFSDYIKSEKCSVRVFVFTKEPLPETFRNDFLKQVAGAKIKGIFRFVTTTDEKLFKMETIDDIYNHSFKDIKEEVSYCISKNFEISNY